MTAQPLKISLHNFYEFVWLLKTGIPRMLRILAGNEPFISDSRILQEGYQHFSRYIEVFCRVVKKLQYSKKFFQYFDAKR